MNQPGGFLGRGIAAFIIATTCAIAADRIVLLPFTDPHSSSSARPLFDSFLRQRLQSTGFEVADKDATDAVLRSLRVRNTAAPLESEVHSLCDSLNARYVLVGTIHSFVLDSVFSEAAVCSRLLSVEESRVVWSNCVALSGGGGHSLFSRPVHKSDAKLARKSVRKLMSSFTLGLTSRRPAASELVVSGPENRKRYASSPVAVIPPQDESEAQFSGDMIAGFLITSLARRGFNVVDPGRVRHVMLQCEDLRHGQSVDAVSNMLADSLNVKLVVTGSISKLSPARMVALGNSPETSVELRMIDPTTNSVIWADHLERSGESGKGLFSTGIVYSPASLALEMIDNAVSSLKIVRRKSTEPNQ